MSPTRRAQQGHMHVSCMRWILWQKKRCVEVIDVSPRLWDYWLTAGVMGTKPHHRDMTSLLGDCSEDNRMSKTESKFIFSSYGMKCSLFPWRGMIPHQSPLRTTFPGCCSPPSRKMCNNIKIVQELVEEHSSTFQVLPWPSNPPDLCPIEHLWNVQDKRSNPGVVESMPANPEIKMISGKRSWPVGIWFTSYWSTSCMNTW